MNQQPLVSVVIPTYNRPELLKRAVMSVVAQSFSNIEVIVVDDNSIEDNSIVLDEIKKSTPSPIKYFKNKTNMGANNCRNQGIASAKGDYIAFLDDDDEWVEKKLSEQVDILVQSNEAGICYTGKNIVDSKGRIRYSYLTPQCIEHINYIGTTSTILVKKVVFDEVGGFDESLPALQDYELYLRILQKYQAIGVDEALINYYEDNTIKRISTQSDKATSAVLAIMKKYKGKGFDKELRNHMVKILLKRAIRLSNLTLLFDALKIRCVKI